MLKACELIPRTLFNLDLTAYASNRFRWVECQLLSIEQCNTLRSLKQTLAKLPRSLYQTYENIWNRSDPQYISQTSLLLKLLCFAEKRLSVAELLDALAIDVERLTYDSELRFVSIGDLLMLCPGFISVYEVTGQWADSCPVRISATRSYESIYPGHMYLQLAHASVKEFLTSKYAAEELRDLCFAPSMVYAELANACMAYIVSCGKLKRRESRELGVKVPPFLGHCRSYWESYARLADHNRLSIEKALQLLGLGIKALYKLLLPPNWMSLTVAFWTAMNYRRNT